MTASGAQLPPRRLRPVVKVDGLTLVADVATGRRTRTQIGLLDDGRLVIVRSSTEGGDSEGFLEDARRSHGTRVGFDPDIIQTTGRATITLPLAAGVDLRTLIDSQAGMPLPLEISLVIAVGVAEELQTLHAEGTLHGDLVPEHVLVGLDGSLHLLDAAGPKSLSRSRLSSRARYRSPEHVRAEGLSGSSDIFGLGLLLFEMTTGQPAFTSAGDDLEDDILRSRVPRPREIVGDGYPIELQLISRKLLRPTPAGRFADGKAAKEALRLVATSRADVSAKALSTWVQSKLPEHFDAWHNIIEEPQGSEEATAPLSGMTPPSRAATLVEPNPTLSPPPPSDSGDDLKTVIPTDDMEVHPPVDEETSDSHSTPVGLQFDEGPITAPSGTAPLAIQRQDTQIDSEAAKQSAELSPRPNIRPPSTQPDIPAPADTGEVRAKKNLGVSPSPRAPSELPSRVSPRPERLSTPPPEALPGVRDTHPGTIEPVPADGFSAELEVNTALHPQSTLLDNSNPGEPDLQEGLAWKQRANEEDVAAAFDAALAAQMQEPPGLPRSTLVDSAEPTMQEGLEAPSLGMPSPPTDKATAPSIAQPFESDTLPPEGIKAVGAGSILDFDPPDALDALDPPEVPDDASDVSEALDTDHVPVALLKPPPRQETLPVSTPNLNRTKNSDRDAPEAAATEAQAKARPGLPAPTNAPKPGLPAPTNSQRPGLPAPINAPKPGLPAPVSAAKLSLQPVETHDNERTERVDAPIAPALAEDLLDGLPALSAESANAADTIQDASAEELFSTDDLAQMQAAVSDPTDGMLPPEMQLFPASSPPKPSPPVQQPTDDPGSSGVISGEAEIAMRPQPAPYRPDTPPEVQGDAPWRPTEPASMKLEQQARIPTQVVRDRISETPAAAPALSAREAPSLGLPEQNEVEEDQSGDLTPLVTPVLVSESLAALEDSAADNLVIPISDDQLERSEKRRGGLLLVIAAVILIIASAFVLAQMFFFAGDVAVVAVPEPRSENVETPPPVEVAEDPAAVDPSALGEAIEPTEVFDLPEQDAEQPADPVGVQPDEPEKPVDDTEVAGVAAEDDEEPDEPIAADESLAAGKPKAAEEASPAAKDGADEGAATEATRTPPKRKARRRTKTPPPAPPVVIVKARPKGTVVVLEDGRRIATPARVELTDGPRTVRLEAPGFETQSLRLEPGQTVQPVLLKRAN